MLARFYAVMGNAPDVPGALNMMADALGGAATAEEINHALNRCIRECRFPVRLPDIFLRIPGHEVPSIEAEMRAAWDTVEKFVSKYVGNDVHGNYSPEFGWYGPQRNWKQEIVREATYPQLSQRLLDAVRRTGGWRAYKRMTDTDIPFQQKRFFEEYVAWTAVSSVPPALVETLPKNLLKM